ncbi:MAG: hypothetical protein ACPLPW_07660, partial [bacterium]
VVKFIVIRPLLGGQLANVDESPANGAISQLPVEVVWKQFNQSLDTSRSTLWVYNTTAHEWVSGAVSFTSKVYPNDTVVFTPDEPLTKGVYLANATGYDAATGGTQSLNFAWTFEVNPIRVTIHGSATYYGDPAEGAEITVKLGDEVLAAAEVGADGHYTCTFDLLAEAYLTVSLHYQPAGEPPPPPWEDSKTVYAIPGYSYEVNFIEESLE